ncbi:MAG: hypothetical protein KGJ23_09700 [Euryarchaeota archaeon]|nr:hypothetical protein [Euryarchaeota archaeon]MDE1836876.1 hypothetical protein [Euryarchaeota archaeon]MDE1881362.1 hypothetical protein [Euryarchaeota archaeon]MDE2045279.1 hypothetical protein [Thermoplasmata archaeon]
MAGDPKLTPPDIDHQTMDDKNFATGDLAQAWQLLTRPTFTIRREMKDIEGYYVEDHRLKLLNKPHILGKVLWVQNGGWSVQDPNGQTLAMLWRQHTEDHSVDNLSSLAHMGFHRWEDARKREETASIYCLANTDKTVRFFVTFAHGEAILDSPSNRPVLKMAKGTSENNIELTDAFDDPVASVHTDATTFAETHEVAIQEAVDPFLVATFTITMSLEMGFEHGGQWRSPYAHLDFTKTE